MQRDTARSFTALASVPFVMVLGNSMLIPVLPTIRAHLDLSAAQVGLLVTAFSLPAGITIPFAGALSDRIGRRTVMIPALLLYGLGGLAAGLAAWLMPGRYWPILAGRVLQGIGAGGTYQLAMALAGDIFQSQERSRALGLLEASNGLGKVVSPLLGSATALVLWFLPFFVYGVVAFPSAVAIWWLVKEARSRATIPPGRYLHELGQVLRRQGVTLGVGYFAGLMALFTLFGVLSLLSDELKQRFGIGGFGLGLLIAIPVAVMSVTAYLVGAHGQSAPRHLKPFSMAGLGVAAASVVALAAIRGPLPLVIAAAGGMGLGVGAVLPTVNLLVTGAASRAQRGVVTALYGTVRFGGVAAGPPLFGLAGSGPARWWIFGATAALIALAALGMAWVRPPLAEKAPEPGPKKGSPAAPTTAPGRPRP